MIYFNDIDGNSCRWIEEIYRGQKIDNRSIKDVRSIDVSGFRRCHFFAGIAGWEYALGLAGWPDDWPVWTGSCPCQPFSGAGKRLGESDHRHLWPEFRRLIAECRPPTIFGEQVARKLGREWLSRVRTDLEALGYAVGAADLCAAGVGAPHVRQRLYWMAYSKSYYEQWIWEPGTRNPLGEMSSRGYGSNGGINNSLADRIGNPVSEGSQGCGAVSRSESRSCRGGVEIAKAGSWSDFEIVKCRDGKTRRTQSGVFPVAHGVPARVGRLRGYGNAIVPQVAATFIKSSMESIGMIDFQ